MSLDTEQVQTTTLLPAEGEVPLTQVHGQRCKIEVILSPSKLCN